MFDLGQNEDCSPGGGASDSTERLLQRGRKRKVDKSGEGAISWVLFCGNKDLKWQTNVTAHLQLRVLFSKQRIVHPWGGRAGRPQRRALNPSWVKFCLFELKWANHTLSPWNVKLECGNRDWNVVGIHLSWQIPLKRFTISSCLPRFLANA